MALPKPPLFGGCGAFPVVARDGLPCALAVSSSAMDAELDDEEMLWAAEEELRAAQLMIEQAQRNRPRPPQLCTASTAAGPAELARDVRALAGGARGGRGASTRSCSRSFARRPRAARICGAAARRRRSPASASSSCWRRTTPRRRAPRAGCGGGASASQRAAGRQVERQRRAGGGGGDGGGRRVQAIGRAVACGARRRARVRGARQPAVGVGAAPVAAARARRHPPRPRARPPRRRVLATAGDGGGARGALPVARSAAAALSRRRRALATCPACASRSATCAATRGGGTRRATPSSSGCCAASATRCGRGPRW